MDAKLFNWFIEDMQKFCVSIITDSDYCENEILYLKKNIDTDKIARECIAKMFNNKVKGMDEITSDPNKARSYYDSFFDIDNERYNIIQAVIDHICDICEEKVKNCGKNTIRKKVYKLKNNETMETNINETYDCDYYLVSNEEIRWVDNDVEMTYDEAYKKACILYDAVCEYVPNPDMTITMPDGLCDRKDCMMLVLFNGRLADRSNRIISLNPYSNG